MSISISGIHSRLPPEVVQALDRLYHKDLPIDYDTIVDRFWAIVDNIPEGYRPLFMPFNPEVERTQMFVAGLECHYEKPSIQQVIETMRNRDTFTSDVIAVGIMSTRLNLPYPIYPVLEVTHLPMWKQWKDWRLQSGMERHYGQNIYSASRRYMAALRTVDRALRNVL